MISENSLNNHIKNKKVKFDLDKNSINDTYSADEYDRRSINSLINRTRYYGVNRIMSVEWCNMRKEINDYKIKEMLVHIDSIHSIQIY